MSFFSTISAIFSTPKTIDKAVEIGAKITDGIISGIDKIWYTDEERAENRQKANETLLSFWKIIANENTEQSKARRMLAVMTFKVYFALILIGTTVYKFDAEYAKFIFEVIGSLTGLVLMVAGVYFGPHQIAKIWKKKK